MCARVQVMYSNTDFTFYLECGHCINCDVCTAGLSFTGSRVRGQISYCDNETCCKRSLPVKNFHLGRGERERAGKIKRDVWLKGVKQ